MHKYIRTHSTAALLTTLSIGCSGKPLETGLISATRTCNGHAELCDRTLDDVTLATAQHIEAKRLAGLQQTKALDTRQLEDGIRGMMLDTMDWNGEDYLYCGYCELGAPALREGLGEIETFLDTNPDNVVLIPDGTASLLSE